MTAYSSISCDLYDRFELYASRKTWVEIETSDGSKLITKIKTIQTRNKEEFAILLDDMAMRLDKVINLNPISKTQDIEGHLLEKLDFNLYANRKMVSVLEKATLSDVLYRLMSHIINAIEIWNQRLLNQVTEVSGWQIQPQNEWLDLLNKSYLDTVAAFNQNSVESMIYYVDTNGTPF